MLKNKLLKTTILVIINFILITSIYSSVALALNAEVTELPGLNKGGKVLVKPTEQSKPKEASLKDIIYENGIIATDKGYESRAELLLQEKDAKAILRIGSSSYLQLNKNNIAIQDGKILVQNQGYLNLTVSVGNYIAASEGTTYTVEVNKADQDLENIEAVIEVLEGEVSFKNEDTPQTKPIKIRPGQRYVFNFRKERLAKQIQKLQDLEHKTPRQKMKLKRVTRKTKRLERMENIHKHRLQMIQSRRENFKILMQGPLFDFQNPLLEEKVELIKKNIDEQESTDNQNE
jgi:hypothetical protein